MKEILDKLIHKKDLTRGESVEVFDRIMRGETTPVQMAAFLTALRMKGESVDEITGAAQSMRVHSVYVDPGGQTVVDTCGTGGDGRNTFNISTTAAFIAAGAGVTVAKHGNRAVTSGCGSADVLQALGVNLDAPPEVVEECLREVGIGFLFAQKLHPAMKHAAPVRRDMGIRTIFNVLGPLTNPAGARRQLLGVFAPQLTELMALVLRELGAQGAWVVHGHDGLDEISSITPTRISELRDGTVRTYDFDPESLIEPPETEQALRGGDPAHNAAITTAILDGRKGPCRDIACLNAAAAILVAGKAKRMEDAMDAAREAIDSGCAAAKLQQLVEHTR